MLLAYAPDRPEGDLADRIELRACLTPQGQIDVQAYLADPLPWPALRVLPDGTERATELVQVESGWALRSTRGGDDAPLWTLDGRVFRPGELVTLRGPDAAGLVFRIVNVEAG